MCNRMLKPMIQKFKNQDMSVFEFLYDEFKKLIMFYAKKLFYDDVACDLTLFLIELFYQIDLSKFMPDESLGIKKYIAVSIKNQYIALSLQRDKYNKISNKIYEDFDGYFPDYEESFSVLESLEILPEKQKTIIIFRYIYGYSIFEIAVMLGISRQAVNNLKNRALNTLKEFLQGE